MPTRNEQPYVLSNLEDREKPRVHDARVHKDCLHLAIEAANIGVWNLDLQAGTTSFSPPWFTMLGYAPDELPHTYETWLKLVHPDDQATVDQRMQDFLAGGNEIYHVESRMQAKDGEWRWIVARGKAVQWDTDGQVAKMVGTCADVTTCKQAEAALRKEQYRVQQYLDVAGVILVALDAQGEITLINRKGIEILGYQTGELIGKNWFDTCLPQRFREDVKAVFARLMAGEVEPVEEFENLVLAKSGEERMIAWHNTVLRDESGQVVGTLSSGKDITERKHTEEALHLYANRLKILHEVEQGILAARSPEAIAQAALGRIRQLVPCQRAGVTLLDVATNELVVLAVDVDAETRIKSGARVSFEPFEELTAAGQRDQDALWDTLHSRATEILHVEGIHSFVGVPLISQNELIGSLHLGVNDGSLFSQEHEDIAYQVAGQLAIAIQQARLHEQVQRHAEELERRVADRTRELSAMYEVMAIASQSLDLETMLAQSLERVLEAMKSSAGLIHLLDQEKEVLHLVVHRGVPPDLVDEIKSLPAQNGLARWIIERSEPLVVPDITADPQMNFAARVSAQTYVGVPIRAGGQILGVLSILRRATQPQFDAEEVALLTSIADQVGAVVDSAQLHQLAEQAAVLEERQRLARDLHDSVTQSLYSLTLLTETSRRAAQAGDLESVESYLGRLGEVARQALKEMRLLIYQLRPPVLEREGLVGALQQRLDAVEGRAGVETRLLVGEDVQLTAPVEDALYRIALEALNNALKHAAATSVMVWIHTAGERAGLEIADNGRGFDPAAVRDRGGMGLINMQERAEKLGGTLTILSVPGEGTRVLASVQQEIVQ
jgi:PAS domain S-box-containing protein